MGLYRILYSVPLMNMSIHLSIPHCLDPYGSMVTFFFFFFFLATTDSTWDLSSLTRTQIHTPCSGSMESYPLDRQVSPFGVG